LVKVRKAFALSAGHHAIERYGIAALARHMTETLGVEVSVVEIGNPV
jgi:putative NIF3 family GTP cyclohydrolase 1 type 2